MGGVGGGKGINGHHDARAMLMHGYYYEHRPILFTCRLVEMWKNCGEKMVRLDTNSLYTRIYVINKGLVSLQKTQ
jgi:hypothetical protein